MVILKKNVNISDIEKLEKVRRNIAYFTAKSSNLSNELIKGISSFENLVKLEIQDNNIDEVTEVILNEASANVEDLKMEIQSNFKNDVNGLHDEINNFFIQYKLDSIQLDVNVDSSEQDA